jgi:hypothetical protein
MGLEKRVGRRAERDSDNDKRLTRALDEFLAEVAHNVGKGDYGSIFLKVYFSGTRITGHQVGGERRTGEIAPGRRC